MSDRPRGLGIVRGSHGQPVSLRSGLGAVGESDEVARNKRRQSGRALDDPYVKLELIEARMAYDEIMGQRRKFRELNGTAQEPEPKTRNTFL